MTQVMSTQLGDRVLPVGLADQVLHPPQVRLDRADGVMAVIDELEITG